MTSVSSLSLLRRCSVALAIVGLGVVSHSAHGQSCQDVWATRVISSTQGANAQSTSATNALGDTPNDYFSLGSGGSITVDFTVEYTNSGDSTVDIYVDEYGVSDCYWICVDPANAATEAAVIAAGFTPFGNLYQIPQQYCSDLDLDLDALVPGFPAGALRFFAFMIEDDGSSGDGAEIVRIRARSCTPPSPPPPPPAGCNQIFASSVVSFRLGANNQGTAPGNILGDTPNDFHSLGDNGEITVSFPAEFSNSGSNAIDIHVDEWGDADCYYVCIEPLGSTTIAAVIAAGFTPFGSLYQIPTSYCGDANIDLDALIPGFPAGALRFGKLMIEDDNNGGNGAEINRIAVNSCPPPPASPCVEVYASRVLATVLGGSHQGTSPTNILGNTPNDYHSLGNNGSITIDFGPNYSTSGSPAPDLFVDEFGVSDCYRLELEPVNAAAVAAVVSAGWTNSGNYYRIPQTYCSDATIDLDALLPGGIAGELQFFGLRIVDDNDGGNGAEIALVRALTCTPPEPICEPGYASSVAGFGLGSTNPSATNLPANALGNTASTQYSIGNGGFLELCFTEVFSTSGDSTTDLYIDEGGTAECYYVGLKPSTSATAAVLQAAGLSMVNGYYVLPQAFCGDVNIDFDAALGGGAPESLFFDCVLILDDANGTNGADIARVRAEAVCNDVSRLGNRVWVDLDCDGRQEEGEGNVAGVVVRLCNLSGTELDRTTTDANGIYTFLVRAGSYRLKFDIGAADYTVTAPNVGTDDTRDSDIDPVSLQTGTVIVAAGQDRTDIDAGVCVICTNVTAFVQNLTPICNNPLDPIMTIDRPILGSLVEITINSTFPNAEVFVFGSLGAPVPQQVLGTSCFTWVNLFTMQEIFTGITDANGDFSLTFNMPSLPIWHGIEFTLQGRVCLPSIPGPIPGFPDWLTNGVFLRFGCP